MDAETTKVLVENCYDFALPGNSGLERRIPLAGSKSSRRNAANAASPACSWEVSLWKGYWVRGRGEKDSDADSMRSRLGAVMQNCSLHQLI